MFFRFLRRILVRDGFELPEEGFALFFGLGVGVDEVEELAIGFGDLVVAVVDDLVGELLLSILDYLHVVPIEM